MPNTNTFFTIAFLTLIFGVVNLQQSGDIPRKVVVAETFAMPPEVSDVGWTGMFDHFIPEGPDNGRMLRLRGNTLRSDTSWLAAPASLFHGEWNYTISIRGEPSNTNRIDLVVMSDSEDLKSPFNGYLLKAGENGSNDVIRLMRVDNGILVPILSGTMPISAGGSYKIRLERNPVGQWTMFAGPDGEALTSQGTATDSRYGDLGYTGFRMIYTRTRNSDYAVGPITIAKNTPHVMRVQTKNPSEIQVDFDTDMAQASQTFLTIDGRDVPSTNTIMGKQVALNLHVPLDPGSFQAHLSGLATADGLFVDIGVDFSIEIEADVRPGDVVINEYMYHPPEDIPQFVELVNKAAHAVNLRGWELRDLGTGNRVITTSEMWLPPNGYIVLTPDSLSVSTYYSAPNVRSMARFPLLNRGSKDSIILRNPAGTTIDSVGYTPKPAGDGVSIERISLQAPSWAPTNWRPSAHRRGATPGESNSTPPEEPADPSLDLVLLEDNRTLRLQFDGEVDPSSITDIAVNGANMHPSVCSTDNWTTIVCNFSQDLPVDPDQDSSIEIRNLLTILGRSVVRLSSPIAHHPDTGDIQINEIMFNPLQSRYDGGTDQSQYVELSNTRDHHVYTGGLTFFTKSATSTSISTLTAQQSSSTIMSPSSLSVLHADTASTENSRLAHFFGLSEGVSYMRTNRSTLSLNSTSGSVWVRYNDTTIDSASYDARYHYPSVRDQRGVSLERISLERSSIDPSNWGSHGGLLGGSPGLVNSIAKVDIAYKKDGIDVHPNPFSPDNDGHEDIAFIHVQLDEPGWLLKATIYDRQGRKVRTLADGERSGNSIQMPWNGIDDKNRRAFTGFYVVVVEAWHVERRESRTYRHILGLIHQPSIGATFK